MTAILAQIETLASCLWLLQSNLILWRDYALVTRFFFPNGLVISDIYNRQGTKNMGMLDISGTNESASQYATLKRYIAFLR